MYVNICIYISEKKLLSIEWAHYVRKKLVIVLEITAHHLLSISTFRTLFSFESEVTTSTRDFPRICFSATLVCLYSSDHFSNINQKLFLSLAKA